MCVCYDYYYYYTIGKLTDQQYDVVYYMTIKIVIFLTHRYHIFCITVICNYLN